MNDTTASTQSNTRERIVQSALRLMSERGFGGVTMKAVAETAGIARQTLYNHFPDVDTIIAESIAAHQTESLEALRGVIATIESPEARLEHLVRQSAATAVHHHPVAGFQHGLSAEMQANLQQHDTELLTIIEETLRAGMDAGDFRKDIDITRDAHLVKQMLDGTAMLASSQPASIQTTVATATRTLLASVKAQ